MNVSLTPELERFVNELVAGGRYTSASEVIRVALRMLDEQEELRRVKLERLKKDLASAVAQADRGELYPLDIEATKGRARQRVAEKKRLSNA